MRLANRHVLVVGGSGSGKTTAEIKDLVELAEQYDSGIVCIDPHTQSLAAGFFEHLCSLGMQHRVLYDRLSDTKRVLKWDFLSPSNAKDPRQRNGENQTRCEQFAEILLRRRGKGSAADTPSIEEWLVAALSLYIHQKKRRPLADLRYVFQFEHPVFASLLEGCVDADTLHKFRTLIESRQTPYKAAERLLMGVLRSAAFQVRTEHDGGFDLGKHLNNYGILIVEGGDVGGSLSRDAMQTMMGSIILKVLTFLRARQSAFPPVVLSLDEANNAKLIGEAGHEVAALAELRKYGLGMRILTQYLDFPNRRIEQGVMTNCATRKYFYCPEPNTAARLGADLGGSYQISEFSNEQQKYASELRNLRVGQCYLRRHNRNVLVQITPLQPPYDFGSHTVNDILEGFRREIEERPEYHSPKAEKRQLEIRNEPTPLPTKETDGWRPIDGDRGESDNPLEI